MSDYQEVINTCRDGVVCFRNKDGLDLDEIKNIFSQYGQVLYVNCAGANEFGYRFVKFRSSEEAVKCAIAMKEHPKIQLQPVRQKNKEQKKNNEKSQYKPNNYNKNHTGYEQTNNGTSHSNEHTHQTGTIKNGPTMALHQTNMQCRSPDIENDVSYNCNGAHDANQRNSEETHINSNNPDAVRKPLSARLARNLGNNEIKAQTEMTLNPTIEKFAELQRRRGTNSNTFTLHNNNEHTESQKSASDILPGLNDPNPLRVMSRSTSSNNSVKKQPSVTDMPPPLVACTSDLDQASSHEPETHVIPAYDIIVANIHSNLGINDIYQIFRNYDLVYVSDIETVPQINIRFCHVYFVSENDARIAEKFFDGLKVLGKYLITLQSHTLELESRIF